MSECFAERIGVKSSFHLLWMLHFSTGFKQLSLWQSLNTTTYRQVTALSSEVSTVFSLVLIVSLSASQTVVKTEEVHS